MKKVFLLAVIALTVTAADSQACDLLRGLFRCRPCQQTRTACQPCQQAAPVQQAAYIPAVSPDVVAPAGASVPVSVPCASGNCSNVSQPRRFSFVR